MPVNRHDVPMAIADEKYVSLTTFRKNGERKAVPVWIADLGDGTFGFTTPSSSWKCKRLRNDPRVELQPSDARGKVKPGTSVVAGTAELKQGADFDRVRSQIKEKYGFQVTMIVLVQKIGKVFGKDGGSDTAVIITLDD